MSDDLISRQAAIDCLIDALCDLDEADLIDKVFFEEELKKVPSIQPIQPEQKTATFYVDSEGYERCSTCNEYESGMRYFNFCPNCGAKMESEG